MKKKTQNIKLYVKNVSMTDMCTYFIYETEI